MIIERQKLPTIQKEMLNDPFRYIVLDAKRLQYHTDSELFKYSIEILENIETAKWANNLCKDLKSDHYIDVDILFKAMNHVLHEKPMLNEDFEKYYNSVRNMEMILKHLLRFDVDEIYIPYKAELILLGATESKMSAAGEEKLEEVLVLYSELTGDLNKSIISISRFIESAKTLIKWLSDC